MNFIEIIGFPGAGKTYLLKKIFGELNKKNINIVRNDKYLFNYFTKNFVNKIILNYFYEYKIKKKFYSKYIFSKQYQFLSNNVNLIIKKKKLSKVNRKFKKILQKSKLNMMGKERALDNFKIDLCTFFLDTRVERQTLINDEGLFQKIFLIYKKKNNHKDIKKIINEYLKVIPTPDLVILLDVNKDICFERASSRKGGFIYEKNNKNEIFGLFSKIMRDIKKILIKKKKKVKKIKKDKNNKKNILKIKSSILKIK